MSDSWKDIKGLNGVYQINEEGLVRSCKGLGRTPSIKSNWHLIKPSMNAGYPVYDLAIGRKGKRKLRFRRKAHVLLWQTFVGDIPKGLELDHIDRNRLNLSISNLRLATRGQNQQNCSKKMRDETPTSHKGIWLNKRNNKWVAEIRINGIKKYLGSFSDSIYAALAYNTAATENFKEFANVNNIKELYE